MKRKLIYTLIFSLSYFVAFAQEKKEDQKKDQKKEWHYKPNFMVGFDLLNTGASFFSDRKLYSFAFKSYEAGEPSS